MLNTDPTDLGPGALYPFCPVRPGGGKPRLHLIWFARDGNPGQIFETPERSVREGRAVHARRVNPLDWYRAHPGELFEPVYFDAAERLLEDYERMVRGMAPSAVDLSRVIVDGAAPHGITDRTLLAVHKVNVAFAAIPEPSYVAGILHGIVCQGLAMSELERCYRLPPRTGQVSLVVGLHNLAIHYGMIRSARRAA